MRYPILRVLAVAAGAVFAVPASAQNIQFNFSLTPPAGNVAWNQFQNATLEKEVECYFSPETVQPKVFPAGKTGNFRKKEPLFETPNVLSLQHPAITPQTKSLVCEARILANGHDISADQIVFALVANNSVKGPLNALVRLDPVKVASVTKTKIAQSPQPKDTPKSSNVKDLEKKKGPEAKNVPQAKDTPSPKATPEIAKEQILSFAEFRIVGTGIVLQPLPKVNDITIADVEKSGQAVSQKYPFPDRKGMACADNPSPSPSRACIVQIEVTVKRSVVIGSLEFHVGHQAETGLNVYGFPLTPTATFPPGVDTVKVLVERGAFVDVKLKPEGVCFTATFIVEGHAKLNLKPSNFDQRRICFKP